MKKLYRSRRTKLLGGVAAGFAEYFNTDITIMRLLFALVAVTIPSSILAYVLAWIIIPEEPLGASAPAPQTVPQTIEPCPPGRTAPTANELLGGPSSSPAAPPKPSPTPPSAPVHPERNRQLFGYILIAVGTIVLAKRFVPSFVWRLPGQLLSQGWPVLIILVGVALIFGAVRGR